MNLLVRNLRHRLVVASVFFLLLASACARRDQEERFLLEQRAALQVMKSLQIHENQFPTRLRTNLAEVFGEVGMEYPEELHRKLVALAGSTGPTNSFFERFATVSGKVINKHIGAEIVAIHTSPFPDSEGGMGRFVIVRKGPGITNWGLDWRTEAEVQASFDAAGVVVPKPDPAMPPKAPRADEAFRKDAQEHINEVIAEYERLHPPPWWRRRSWQAAGAALVLGGALYAFFRLRRRP